LQRSTQLKDPGGLDALVGDFELVQGGVTVRGKVTDKATGKPIAGAMVDYMPLYRNPYVDQKLSGAWSPRSEVITGPEGLIADAGGNLAGGAGLPALYNAYVLLEPDENDKALVKDVALEAPQERKGRVVGPDGQPLAGVQLRGRKTSAGGEFTLRGLNPRQGLKVVFYHKEKKLGFFLKEPPGQKSEPLVIKLQPCGSVVGRLVDPDGQPLANKRMHIDGLERFELVNADKEGRFRIEGLVPGVRYMLTRQQLPEVNYALAQPSLAYVSVEPAQTKDLGDVEVEH